MKLKLINFRCYLEKEFDFGSEGLLLLSGHSGAGKSTILLAINFVLYDAGTKLVTFGKTNCKVEMEFEELVITRTKRPNRLTVFNKNTNEHLEDEAGQGVINERFGSSFDTVSYLQQNAINSFITMSPLEKLAFLEKFAFNNIDLSKLKIRCNNLIKARHDELITCSSQLNMATEHFNTLTKPTKVAFPLKSKDKEKALKNEAIKYNNCKILIKRAEKALENLKQEINDFKLYFALLLNKAEIICSIQSKIDNLNSENKIEYEGDEKLIYYQETLKTMLKQKELFIVKEKYEKDKLSFEQMKKAEENELQNELDKLKSELWKEYSPSEIDGMISDYKQCIKDCEIFESLNSKLRKYIIDEKQLDENKTQLESIKQKFSEQKQLLMKLIQQQKVYKCPSCKVSLKLQDNTLCVFNNEIVENYTIKDLEKDIFKTTEIMVTLEKDIQNAENKLKMYKEIEKEIEKIKAQYEEFPNKIESQESLEYLQNYKLSQNSMEKRCKKLESNIKNKEYSSSLKSFQEQLLKQEMLIKDVDFSKNFETDEEDLRSKIEIQKQNRDKLLFYKKQIKTLTEELNTNKKEINTLKENWTLKYPNNNTKDTISIEKEIESKNHELANLKQALQEHENINKKIEEYNKYKEEMKRYEEWETKVKVLLEEESKNKLRYSASTQMKEKILQAESIAILNVINSINIHAQEYLDMFFPVDPISVKLCPFKETKKNTSKPQINIEIEYKGMEADISTLSGGELARVVLAYTLALAEIFNSPLILLDECTASLDQELATIVMEGIKKNFGNKLVIVIAHQVISGDFDKQICL